MKPKLTILLILAVITASALLCAAQIGDRVERQRMPIWGYPSPVMDTPESYPTWDAYPYPATVAPYPTWDAYPAPITVTPQPTRTPYPTPPDGWIPTAPEP